MKMDYWPKISIVTPNYNGGKYLEETILSVLGQGYPNLEYIIIDGGSSDSSTDIIKKFGDKLAFWISEPDKGMYYAIQKGFEHSTGEIMGWINSDDILQKKSLFTIAEIFNMNREILWVQGYPNVIDELSRIVDHRPQRSGKYSYYLKDYKDGIFIQQESTFWTRELWVKSGASMTDKYKYAGDFELWMRFFRYTVLYNTKTLLGSFRKHGVDQISNGKYGEYMQECDQIILESEGNLTNAEKRRLSNILNLRRIKKCAPWIYKLLNLNKLEVHWLSNSLSVEFEFTAKQYKNL